MKFTGYVLLLLQNHNHHDKINRAAIFFCYSLKTDKYQKVPKHSTTVTAVHQAGLVKCRQ